MAQQKGQGPAGDGTKGVLGKPTLADQLEAEESARARQDAMGWEPAPPRPAGGSGTVTTKSLSKAQRADLKTRIKAKLGLAAGKRSS